MSIKSQSTRPTNSPLEYLLESPYRLQRPHDGCSIAGGILQELHSSHEISDSDLVLETVCVAVCMFQNT